MGNNVTIEIEQAAEALHIMASWGISVSDITMWSAPQTEMRCNVCDDIYTPVMQLGDTEPVMYICASCGDTKHVATGATQRLTLRCAVCDDELPTGAAFCVTCGAKQQHLT